MDKMVEESTLTEQVYDNAITDKKKERVAQRFPFSIGSPDWAISLLLESNNIDSTEKVI